MRTRRVVLVNGKFDGKEIHVDYNAKEIKARCGNKTLLYRRAIDDGMIDMPKFVFVKEEASEAVRYPRSDSRVSVS